jgi:excisionase family DNA binding protein
METQQLTFEQVPAAVQLLLMEVASLKALLQTSQPAEPDNFMNVTDASNYLQLAKPTVYALLSRGDLPNFKRGKKVFFKKADLDTYLLRGRRNSKTV